MPELDFLSENKQEKKEIVVEKKIEPKRKNWRSFFKFSLKKNPGEKEILATDLIQREVVTYFNWKKNILILSGLILLDLLVLFSVYQGIIYWEKNQKEEVEIINSKLDEVNVQVAEAEKNLDEINNFQNKLDQVKYVLDHHVYWTNFFDFLEDNILKDVTFSGGFSGKTDGKFTFSAETKDFYVLSEQLRHLKENGKVLLAYSNGGAVGGKFGESSLGFNLEIVLDPSIFYNKQ